MNLTRRSLLALLGLGGQAALAACERTRPMEEPAPPAEEPEPAQEPVEQPEEPDVDLLEFEAIAVDMDSWSYDEVGDCYYQLGLPYCLNAGSEQYGSMAVFVPGPYFDATRHGRRYACTVNEAAQVGSFTAKSAPIAIPVNARSFVAQESPTTYSYEGLDRYLKAGIVYVYAGIRGRSGGYESSTQEYFSGGAPWPVADLKAVVRALRYNAGVLPGDTGRIVSFGQGGGGGVVAALAASGNATAYQPYLEALGAATHDAEGTELSDDVFAAALWCPVASLGIADAAYEWMMGQYAQEGTRAEGTWTALLSRDLAAAYGSYINELGLTDKDGTALTLDRIEDGSYGDGSYYQHLLQVVADAATDFFARTDFPYTVVPSMVEDRSFPGDPALRTTEAASAGVEQEDGAAQGMAGVRQVEATVYETLESYVASLNGDSRWLTYNASRGVTDITGLWGFSAACRKASADVGAYDMLDRSGCANQLYGTDEQTSLHFDSLMAQLIEGERERYAKAKGWDEELVAAYRGDLAETDAMDLTVADRVSMSDPMSYLRGDEERASDVAAHWRINTGLSQSQTTLAGEMNLALALAAHDAVSDVQFEPVWEAGLGLVERSGDAEDNLVAWIASCCAGPSEDDKPSAEDAAGQDEPKD